MPEPSQLLIPNTPSISFSDACLGDDGVREICLRLESRRDVTSLDLRGCHVHSAGAAALKSLLMGSGGRVLGSLSLEWNSLGTSDAGPRMLADAVAANVALTSLDLRNNRMSSSAVASIADALRTNGTLVTLDLRWNSAGVTGGYALEAALAENHTLIRLPLQGNRVAESTLKEINKLLARNSAAHVASAPPRGGSAAASAAARAAAAIAATAASPDQENAFATASHVSIGGTAPQTPLQETVHSRTLESALVVQQAEFSNKLRHAQERAEAAESTLNSERSRADVANSRIASAEDGEFSARQQVALLQQELTATRAKADLEVLAAKDAAKEAEAAMKLALSNKTQVEAELADREKRIAHELEMIQEREDRAQQAEARAAETSRQLALLNERLLEERKNHSTQLVSMQDRLSEVEAARTSAELRLASADSARAAAISDALAKQSSRYEDSQSALRTDLVRLEEVARRCEEEKADLRAETERVRAEGDARVRSAEGHLAEREAKTAATYEARIDALTSEKEAMREAHRAALNGLRGAEEARWAQHEEKLAANRDEYAKLERKLHEQGSVLEGKSRELARSQSDLAAAAHSESTLKDAYERQKQASLEQAESLQKELVATRKHWEGRLAHAVAESRALSSQLIDAQRALQMASGKWEASMQSLQHSVLGCFQQTIEKSRISPTTTSAQPEPAAVSFTSEGDVQVTTEQERPTGGHHGRAPPPQHGRRCRCRAASRRAAAVWASRVAAAACRRPGRADAARRRCRRVSGR